VGNQVHMTGGSVLTLRPVAVCTYSKYTLSHHTKTSTYRGGEEGSGGQGVLDERALHDVGLAADGRQQPAGEDLAGVCLQRVQPQITWVRSLHILKWVRSKVCCINACP
jgi:hypothetical protein